MKPAAGLLAPLLILLCLAIVCFSSVSGKVDCDSSEYSCPSSCKSLASTANMCKRIRRHCGKSPDWCADCLKCAFSACEVGSDPQDYDIFTYCY
ncbi:hypothetical protein BOX15_Mlig003226g3 [Macrostomum lignano]|uniref:ShKT domain-containing protein n=1 Tax=Macrostomum lignano TaxID=282301 RepID=A0A267GFA8_9PLAT|nr:hypothetical protein BOX15_Mlig003226g3 [Macrostomum lignano]